jgi:hypothetical protein
MHDLNVRVCNTCRTESAGRKTLSAVGCVGVHMDSSNDSHLVMRERLSLRLEARPLHKLVQGPGFSPV